MLQVGCLSFLAINVPDAIGTPVPLDSQYDAAVVGAGILAAVSRYAAIAAFGYIGIQCHLVDQCIYGLEKKIFVSPN